MNRAQPQQARGFEFYPQQPQQQQQQQQPPQQQQQQQQQQPQPQQQQQQQQHSRQSIQQPALSFQTTAPTLSSSPCNQYVASPRLPVGIGQQCQGVQGATSLYAEPAQFAGIRQQAGVAESDTMKRELEKSRAQISQLEKTLKWWSDCTANWREKWSKEKAERRKLKDELAQIRSSFDQTIAREVERIKLEFQDGHVVESGTSPLKRASASLTNTGVGTGDTLHRSYRLGSATGVDQVGLSLPTESTANFELQELLAETSSALEHERSENAELKSEMDRLTAEQTALKTELSLLKETISTIGGSANGKSAESGNGELSNGKNSRSGTLYGLPSSAVQLIDTLQGKIDLLEKDVASRQMERLSDWNLIDRLESERALLRGENERLTSKLEEIERALMQKSECNEETSPTDILNLKEVDLMRAEVHCLRRLVNRQTQELDHVNFLLSNQETETKLLRSRLLQPWGATASRSANSSAATNSQTQS